MNQGSPRKALADLIADREAVQRAAQAAPILLPQAHPAVAFARCLFLLAGWALPAVGDLSDLAKTLAGAGWQVIPPLLGGPQPGDLYVLAGAGGIESLGFVGPLALDQSYFSALGPDGERRRMAPGEAAFFLRLPCSTCDGQARPAGQPGRR